MNDITLFSDDLKESVEITLPESIYDEYGFTPKEGRDVAVCMANIASLDKQARYLIGNELFKIKEIVKGKHKGGGWIKFCEYLPYSWRTADTLIEEATNPEFFKLFKKFGTAGSHLILSAPKAIREEVKEKALELHEQGESTKNKDIQKLIADTKAEMEKKVRKAEDEARRERELREKIEQEKINLEKFTSEPQVIEKEIIKEVVKEVIPDDYDELKRKENILDDAERAAAILKQSTEQEIKEKQELIDHLQDRIQGERSILKMRTEENASLQAINSSIETRLKEYTRFTNYLQMIDAWVSNDLSISDPWAGFGNVDSEMLRRMSLLTIKISNEIEKIVMENTGGFTDGTTVEGFIVPASYYVEK